MSPPRKPRPNPLPLLIDHAKTIGALLALLAALLAGVWSYADSRYVTKSESNAAADKNSREHKKMLVKAARTEAIVEMLAQQQGLRLPPRQPEDTEGEGNEE